MKGCLNEMIKRICIDIGAYIKFLILISLLFDVLFMIIGGDQVSLSIRVLYCMVNALFLFSMFLFFYYPKHKKWLFGITMSFFVFINVFCNLNDELRWHFDRENCKDMDFSFDEVKKVCIKGKVNG